MPHLVRIRLTKPGNFDTKTLRIGPSDISQYIPTGGLWSYDPTTGLAVVLVPDEDFPEAFDGAHPTVHRSLMDPHHVGEQPAWVAEWHAHLDKRYAERAGDFRPQIG